MKRSEINRAIRHMERMAAAHGFALPPFCAFSPADWANLGPEYDEVRRNMLGWDVTDYGEGDFPHIGFTLITLRNGSASAPEQYPKPYAEKLLLLAEGQYSPMHFHFDKMEDIINRGGGTLLIRVFASTDAGELDSCDVTLHSDGCERTVPAGTQIRLLPGQSLTIPQRLYHDFEVEPGTGDVLIGEVSMVNDDKNDNRFLRPLGRFPQIEEDEPAFRLLCSEYPAAKRTLTP